MTSTRRFPCQPQSVAAARHFARDALRGRTSEVVEAAELMISELATNAVRHARSAFELTIHTTNDELRVEVRDAGEGQPTLGSPNPREHSGRGLRIVEAMAEDWGVTPTSGGQGKLVWFTLPAREQAQTHLAEPADSHKRNLQRGDATATPDARRDPQARSECSSEAPAPSNQPGGRFGLPFVRLLSARADASRRLLENALGSW